MKHINNYIGVETNGDTNACTVHTLSAISGKPFEECQSIAASFGRRFGKGMLVRDIVKMLRSEFDNIEINRFRVWGEDLKQPTIAQFIKDNPTGTHYVCTRNHALAIIDGVLMDHSRKLRRRLEVCYTITSNVTKKPTKKVAKRNNTSEVANNVLNDLKKMTQKQVAERYGLTVGQVKGIVWRNKHN